MTVLELHEMLADVSRPERGQYLDAEFAIEGPSGKTGDAWPAFAAAGVVLSGVDLEDIDGLEDVQSALGDFGCYLDIGAVTPDQWRAEAEAVVARLIQWGAARESLAAERN